MATKKDNRDLNKDGKVDAVEKSIARKKGTTPHAKPEPEQATQPLSPPGEAVALTLTDLVLVAQIINLTSQRGAFQADELAQVGGLYNKLINFLQSVGAITPTPAPEETQPKEPKK
tara:strand:+ start:216 stop:563 length:348 start_codon:yes stop_codon:yes gene_type:complete